MHVICCAATSVQPRCSCFKCMGLSVGVTYTMPLVGASCSIDPDPCRAQGGSQARSRATEKEMPRETLERIAAQLGSLDGEPLQVPSLATPA